MKNLYKVGVASILLAFIVLTSFDHQIEESTVFVDSTIPMWEMSKTNTLEVLDAMPEDKMQFKPTEVSKTFASQMVHIGYTLSYFTNGMIKGNKVEYQEPDASGMSKAEIREMVVKGFDDMIGAIQNLSEEDLKVELPFGPEKKLTRAQSILFAHDHTTNHRAKANLYVRMNEIDPPGYKFM